MTPPRINYLEIAQTFVAYVAIPTALVYPFGFVALFLQFTRYFGFEVYTAWYATSLVNRMVVVGQGAVILAVTLFGSVLLSVMVSQILFLRGSRPASNSVGRWVLLCGLALSSVAVPVLYVLYGRVLAAGRLSWEAILGKHSAECFEEAMRHQLNFWPDSLIPATIFVLGGVWGGRLIYDSYSAYCGKPFAEKQPYPVADYGLKSVLGFFAGGTFRFLYKGITQRWILPGLTVAYVFGIAASLVLASATPGFMPFMTYGSNVYAPEQETTLGDRFLSYSEGRWHFIHRITTEEGEREYRIVALRESAEEAEYVRVRPHPERRPRVAPFPWENPSTGDLRLCPINRLSPLPIHR
jgi:hypothetical protein